MSDTRAKLSTTTVLLHWIVGLGTLIVLLIGLYLSNMLPPRSALKGQLEYWHISLSLTLLIFVLWRIVHRLINGMPDNVATYTPLERVSSRIVHWTLLFAALLLPLSGFWEPFARAQSVPFWGYSIPSFLVRDNQFATLGESVHRWLGYALLAVIVLHVAGALKHHIIDGDGTLRRMLGMSVG